MRVALTARSFTRRRGRQAKTFANLSAKEQAQLSAAIQTSIARNQASEFIRKQQQGLGKPVIATKHQGHQVVAVGNTVFFSKKWKTFPDFLSEYLKHVLGKEYFTAEIAKPFNDRNPLLQWCETFYEYQKQNSTAGAQIHNAAATGIVYCYLGVAYNLYLLSHNVELQKRLVDRLKKTDQFHGAYYELIVANILIRAGFKLELEDESDQGNKHCEFAAISQRSGKKYWIEAKARGVSGILGKTELTGVSATERDATTRLIKQINDALAKPADSTRLIFVDVNTQWSKSEEAPNWVLKAEKRLKAKEQNLPSDKSAYIFITNASFHLHQDSDRTRMEAFVYGLGISDFGKVGYYRYSQLYRMKQKHIDAHDVIESLKKYPAIPSTFDGGLPSESFGITKDRSLIGETYAFPNLGVTGTLLDAVVMETEKTVTFVIRTTDGQNQLISKPLTDAELADYKAHPEGYFGVLKQSPKPISDPLEFFEIMLAQYGKASRPQLLALVSNNNDQEFLNSLSDEDLLIEVCDRMMVGMSFKKAV